MHQCILYELCYPILHRRLQQQLALSPGCGRGALFFYGLLIVSYPQLKALSAHDVCAYTYTHIYICNELVSKLYSIYLYVLQRAAIIIYIGTRGDHNIIIITVVVVVHVVAVYLYYILHLYRIISSHRRCNNNTIYNPYILL